MSGHDRRLDLDGPVAPPRRNGELVFEAPWEARLFGLTLALHDAGVFVWEEFRTQLIAAIADWEKRHGTAAEWRYYERWFVALETVLRRRGICGRLELDARARELAARPPGHDH